MMAFDAPPPTPSPFVMIEQTSDHQPAIFLGFLATGDEQAKRALAQQTSALGFKVARSQNDKGEDEVMVSFPARSDRAKSLKLFHDADQGRFGVLKVEVILVPTSALADGFDLGKDAVVTSSSQVTDIQP